MDLSQVSGLGSSNAAPKDRTNMGKDDFLKLMLAQLSHQDPTSPADSQAFVAQLAQFANVEQLQNVNSQLQTLLVAQASSNQTQAITLVGKDVQFKSTAVSWDGVKPAPIRGDLSADAAKVTAVVTDKSGKVVRTIELTNAPKGTLDMTWDGRDNSGNALPKGEYTVKLTANDVSGANVPVETRGYGRVTGISFAQGYPQLQVGGLLLSLGDVVTVTESAPATSTPTP